MNKQLQGERAERFRALHKKGTPLVLANAWDAASARLFARAGFAAIGTTSAGVAWSLGYPDGQYVPVDMLVETVERIVALLEVPLTVDIERGYGTTPEEVCGVVRRLIDAGAVGVNIEDGTEAPQILSAKVSALRQLADRVDVPLFINARTDVYLKGLVPPADRLAESTRRLKLYIDAGADGVFAPGIAEIDEIQQLATAVPRPLNVYAMAGLPSVPELARAGVARLSVGCGPLQAALGLLQRIATELQQSGTYTAMTDRAFSAGEVNKLLAR